MATKDNAYGEPNARDASFTQAETAVMLWAVGASSRWERLFFELVQASDEITRSELHLVFPYLVGAFTEFADGDLRARLGRIAYRASRVATRYREGWRVVTVSSDIVFV